MQIEDLATLLSERVANAATGERVTQIHLFGIEYAEEIGDAATRVVQASDIDDSYATEVRKGMRLAKYVRLA
ncbi:HTH-like domain-containing protein [Qipengyuania sp. DGS2-2]|uniref:HTH-like domain-containing protein n=1 Tax=Qipengyuania sp. DGS2-2 TaxID=3349631 RepID=UPI003CD0D6B8